jgi:predicted GNAT family N-acyltransferase
MKNQYTISTDALPSVSELSGLFAQADWARKRNHGDIEKLLQHTDVFVVVRDGGSLVGFGRALSDGVFRALVDDIIVDQAHRSQGIGQTIVRTLMKQLSAVEEVFLNTGHHLESFYSKYGFKEFDGLTMVAEEDAAADAVHCAAR